MARVYAKNVIKNIYMNAWTFPQLSVIYGEPLRFEGDRKNREDLEAFSQRILDSIRNLKEKVK